MIPAAPKPVLAGLLLVALYGLGCGAHTTVAAPDAGTLSFNDASVPIPDAGAPVSDGGVTLDGGGEPDAGSPPDAGPVCAPSCVGRACGSDGCEGSCGECMGSEDCSTTGQCVARPLEDCARYPYQAAALLAERVGFGAQATGGNPANVYHVTTLADSGTGSLRVALESTQDYWIVFDVEGEIRFSFDDKIRVKSNKTVDGRGRTVKLRDGQFTFDTGTKNVIFTDVEAYFHDPEDDVGDLISIRGHAGATANDYDTRDLWFHHLDLHHAGDGLLDNRGGTNMTISWVHVHDHTKIMLHTKDTDNKASPEQRITYHHNFFDTVTRRSPHFAYGKADFFNNYQFHWYEYGAASIDGAQFLSENNIYEARPGTICIPACPDPSPHGGGDDFTVSKKAVSYDWSQDQTSGYVKSVGDRLLNGAIVAVREPTRVFNRATYYAATPDVANDALRDRIKAESGPRTTYCR